MRLDFLQRTFWAATQQVGVMEDLDCFIVDNNGFILISERPQERYALSNTVSRTLCSVGAEEDLCPEDGWVVMQEHTRSNWNSRTRAPPEREPSTHRNCRVTMYDYQAMCKPPSHHHSAARPLVSVTHKHRKQDMLQPCDTEYPVFVHQRAIQEANGIIDCGACQK
ncbi:Voltage-dependent calcium channel subunit alpha-2/delta-4 [Myotis brandtii]|uniref:Voltage-dependent calcium channel subunit alpha-2/delta-4 n=1 Tax=Myotis brandtii TaxID=109478 RepID=S7MT23_MYOBR|nr:Voltage-dependent calcium channel subunit alpha-2/delta-4 [Myotis brandtii]